jgi:hypothetical protein
MANLDAKSTKTYKITQGDLLSFAKFCASYKIISGTFQVGRFIFLPKACFTYFRNVRLQAIVR